MDQPLLREITLKNEFALPHILELQLIIKQGFEIVCFIHHTCIKPVLQWKTKPPNLDEKYYLHINRQALYCLIWVVPDCFSCFKCFSYSVVWVSKFQNVLTISWYFWAREFIHMIWFSSYHWTPIYNGTFKT